MCRFGSRTPSLSRSQGLKNTHAVVQYSMNSLATGQRQGASCVACLSCYAPPSPRLDDGGGSRVRVPVTPTNAKNKFCRASPRYGEVCHRSNESAESKHGKGRPTVQTEARRASTGRAALQNCTNRDSHKKTRILVIPKPRTII